ncbi:MAG: tetratricopeptide repeat protein [Chloroflexi bacterium]|nr:tetratricopeptide repeat protein [Chloroflexota bacterium]
MTPLETMTSESDLTSPLSGQEKIDAMNALAWELRYDDIARALALSQAARDMATQGEFEAQPYQKGLAESLRTLGHCYERLADYDLAVSHLSEALTLFQAMANPQAEGTVLYLLGGAYWSQGNYFSALDYEFKALRFCQDVGDKFALGKALNIIGLVYQSVGVFATALDYFLQSLQTYEEIGSKLGQGDALSNCCEVLYDLGEYEKALPYGLKSLQIHEDINYRSDMGIVLVGIGRVYLALQQYPQAFDYLHRALDISRETGNRYGELRALLYLGDITGWQRENDTALSFLHQALVIAHEIGVQQELYECYQVLSQVYKQREEFEKALIAHEQFFTLKQKALEEIAWHKLKIFEIVFEMEATRQEAEAQRLKNIELEQAIKERQLAEEAWQASMHRNAQIEEALKESEDRLRHTFSTISDHIYVTELTQAGLPINRFVSPTEALTGYSEEKILANWDFWPSTLIHPDDRARAAAQFQHFVRGESNEVEYRLIRADDRVIWVRDSGRVERDPLNQNIIVYGVVSDITVRKQMEEALLLQQKRLRSLYELTTQAELAVDQQFKTALEVGTDLLSLDIGIISRIEEDTYEVLHCHAPGTSLKPGQTFELGQTYCNLALRANDVVTIDDVEQSAYRGHPCYQTFQLVSYIGVPLWVQGKRIGTLNFSSPRSRSSPFSQADRDFVQLMEKWVSTTLERQHAQMVLQETLNQLQDRVEELSTLNQVAQAVATMTDLRKVLETVTQQIGELLHAHSCAANLLNPARTELTVVAHYSQSTGFTDTTGRVYLLADNPADASVIKTGQSMIVAYDQPNLLTDSSYEFLRQEKIQSLMLVALQARGQVIGTISVASPIPHIFTTTEMRLVETIAGQIAGAMEIARLFEQEQQLRQKAEEASRLKSQLLAKVSHELRTPLGAILGYTELLQNGVFGQLSDKQQEATVEIIDSTNYLTHLVNELLDQAKFEMGKVSLIVAPFRLAELVNQVQSKMIVLAQAKNLLLTIDMADELPSTLVGDQKRLQQILVNLISNGIKFTNTGEVEVRFYQPDPVHWAIRVTDTGIGIPPEAQNYIFEPFQQVDGSITREHVGTGLGLSIVKQLTTLMGGEITLKSEVERGSTFTVLLPLNPILEKLHD